MMILGGGYTNVHVLMNPDVLMCVPALVASCVCQAKRGLGC